MVAKSKVVAKKPVAPAKAVAVKSVKPAAKSATKAVKSVAKVVAKPVAKKVPAFKLPAGQTRITKADIVALLSDKHGDTKVKSQAYLEDIISIVQTANKSGKEVVLVGFGTFKVVKRAARLGFNPETKTKMKISARKIPVFRPGSEFKSLVK